MKPSLAPRGMCFLLGVAAVLSEGSMSLVSKAGIVCDGYTHKIMGSSRHKDYQVATAERIFSTFFMPLLYETCLEDTTNNEAVRFLRGGGSQDRNSTHPTKANKAIVKLVCGIRGGVAYHNYTGQIANSTVVEGDEQARGKKESIVQQFPRSEGLLENLIVSPKIELDVPDSTTTAAATTAITSSSYADHADETHVDVTSDMRDPEKVRVHRGVQAALKASKKEPFTPKTKLLSRHKADMLKTTIINRNNMTRSKSKLLESRSDHLIVNAHVPKHLNNDRNSNKITELKPNLTRSSNTHSVVVKSASGFAPKNPWVTKRTSRPADNRGSKLLTGAINRSARFEKDPARSSTENAGAKRTDPRPMQSTKLSDLNPDVAHKKGITIGETLTGPLRLAEGGLAIWPRVGGFSRIGKLAALISTEDAKERTMDPWALPSTAFFRTSDAQTAGSNVRKSQDFLETNIGKSSRLRSGAERARPSGLPPTYPLRSDHETSPEIPSTPTIVPRGQGGGKEDAGPRVMLPINLQSTNPETVWGVLKTRKVVLQGRGGEMEAEELGETRFTGMKPDPDKRLDMLTTTRPFLQGEVGKANLLRVYPERVLDVLTTARAVFQEQGVKMSSPDLEPVLDVVRMPGTDLEENGGKLSDSAGNRKRTAGGWLPWPGHAKEGRWNHIFAATTKTEEPMGVSEAKRGCVLETVDGATVITQSGHFTWGWVSRAPWKRPKNHKHHECVSEQKWEVGVGGRKVWSLSEDDWMGCGWFLSTVGKQHTIPDKTSGLETI